MDRLRRVLLVAEPYAVLLIAGGAIMVYTNGISVYPNPASHIPSILGWTALGVGAGAMAINEGYLAAK